MGNGQSTENDILYAIKCDDDQRIKYLLQYGGPLNINYQTPNGKSLLQFAVEMNNPAIVKLLLDAGCDVNKSSRHGCVLHHICEMNQTGLFGLVCKYSPNFNKKDKQGNTPLLAASIAKNTDMVKAILQQTSIERTNHDESSSVMKMLTSSMYKVIDAFNARPYLMQGNHIDATDSKGRTALHYACFHGDVESVYQLLEHGAQVNFSDEDDVMPLHIACRYGHTNVLKVMLKKGADASAPISKYASKECGFYPMHIAAKHNFVDIIQILCEAGCDVNVLNSLRRTPLSLACQHGHTDIVKCLLKYSADPNIVDELGQFAVLFSLFVNKGNKTAFEIETDGFNHALLRSKCIILEDLLLAGADMHRVDNNGHSAFEYACLHCTKQQVAILVKYNTRAYAACSVYDKKGQVIPFENVKLLLNASFGYRKCLSELLTSNSKVPEHYVQYIQHHLSKAPSLQTSCRDSIRDGLSNCTAKVVVNQINQFNIPTSLKHFLNYCDINQTFSLTIH